MCPQGRVFLISRKVPPRPPPRRGLGPLCKKQKQTSVTSVTCAAGEILRPGDLKIAVSLKNHLTSCYSNVQTTRRAGRPSVGLLRHPRPDCLLRECRVARCAFMHWLQVDDKAKVPMSTSPSEFGQPQAGAAPLPCDHDYGNAFKDMMGARSHRVLPSQHACTAVGQLTSDKTAFNLLVSHCEQNGLGVLTNELPACTRMLEAVCNVLRAMDGRNQFQSWRIPQRFQECVSTPERPAKRFQRSPLGGDAVGRLASALRSAIDGATFASAAPWATFLQDADELHAVLQL